jgi:dihydrofolate synthase / folylpolyglutamate synthase
VAYLETVQYLESFVNYEKIPVYPYKESIKLERIKGFLAAINNPQAALRCLHVAGTKGKGSTCAFISYILKEAGYKAGLYTSPHLSDFRERIRILTPGPALKAKGLEFEGMISENEVAALVERSRPAIDAYNKHSEYGPLTFFEVYTSLAFLYFKEQRVDFAVLETGLGGRLDATNVVNSLAAVIAPISYEHTQKLGNTLREIAAEKAGIIKNGCLVPGVRYQPIVISAPQEKEAAEVIRNKCEEAYVKLYEVGKDITYQKDNGSFKINGIIGEYTGLKIRLFGEHQLANAALAVGAIEALKLHNINIASDAIKGGLYNTLWPGRCEVVSHEPLIVLDGAQNTASMKTLKEAIRREFSYKKLILVLGVSNDKDIKGICGEIYGLVDEVILTKADNPRATGPEILAEYFSGKPAHMADNVKEAKETALRIAQKEDLILVCGSLFVVGEFRDAQKRH